MDANKATVRVGIYGTGRFANQTHLPNLSRLPHVELVAASDPNTAALADTAAAYSIPLTYQDPHQMLAEAELDALYSIVPAFARTDVEAAAAASGIHLFSEKPQSTRMEVARRIAAAVNEGGVLSTVCFRERYRPLFQEARRLLADKAITHVRFQNIGGLAPLEADVPDPQSWHYQMDKAGGHAFDWGVHAVDYTRYMTGLNLIKAQAFYHHPPAYNKPLSCSFNFLLENGAPMSSTFLATTPTAPGDEPRFTIFYEGGYLALWMYERIEVNGEIVYEPEEFDPWFAQDQAFTEAVRTGDSTLILNDYSDGLFSLGPVLAGWESARRAGELIDVAEFMRR
ncbi:MAG: Gfo/Idh/MocA family oxidoreductase [Candidatus Latescibacterota bacterium]|nr:Gfo/Idh/MocA family oxidoreductase [Candidatus Latescibacterota bacterium]